MKRALLVGLAFLASSCGAADLCENSSPVDIASPGGERRAWVFLRDCGATVATSVHVSILPADSPAPSEAGNTFVADQGSSVSVDWESENALRISHEGAGQVFKQEEEVGGVAVSYRGP